MDLLFKRYASPFLFINGMIQTGRFCEFVYSFTKTINAEKEEETSWEFFLHRVFEGSYADFKEMLRNNKNNKNLSERTIETTVQHSMKILNNFNPDERGEDTNGIV